ncbi:EAL domain-containing protein [Dyella subtropica]|uniref:EAL domain-containing protein n=1 Tax=Dyella subtropica TaxID=2992127 RepID=UPI00225B96B9|nr:EAL domain-containing protein [Dyella subtropica]
MKHSNKTSGVEILVAEDSPTQAERLRFLLEGHGHTVTVATDGLQALEACRQRKPVLIVSDVMMPGMDGFELCTELKQDKEFQDIPIVLLTTLSDVSDIMKGLQCGADNFIRKPYEDRYLLARIDCLLMTNELRRNQKIRMGVEIYLGGEKHFITAERQQIVDLLISVYEEAIHLSEDLKERQRELADSNSMLAGLYHVAEGLNLALSERDVCEQALEHAMYLPGVQAGWIALWDGRGSFRLGAALNLPEGSISMDGGCECQRRFLAGERQCASNMEECERLKSAGGKKRRPSHHAYIPLWSGKQSLGILNLVRAEQGVFKEGELESLYGVGHQVAVALERARLYEHLEGLVDERTAELTTEIAERKRVDKRFHMLFEFAPDAVVMIAPSGVIALVNRQAEAVFGYPRDELIGERVDKLLPHGFRQAQMDVDRGHATPPAMEGGGMELIGLRKDGASFPVDISLSPMGSGEGVMVAAAVRDVTQRKVYEARIARLNRIYAVLSSINTTIVRVRERQQLYDEACRIAVELGNFSFAWIGTFDAVTQAVTPVASMGRDDDCLRRIDLGAAEEAPLNCPSTLQFIARKQPVICNDIAADENMRSLRTDALSRGYRSAALFPLILQDELVGVLGLYSAEANVFDAEENRLLVEMAGDISFAMDHIASEDRLNYLSFYDAITGLPNRMLFLDRVGQKIHAARRSRKALSVIMLDLIRFSRINESLGRQAGDELLRQLSARLREELAETDVLAHFSTDHFGIATHYDDERVTIVHILEGVLSAIQNRPFLISGQELSISARAGIASYPGDGKDIDALLYNAESALKNARMSGDKYLFYRPSFNVMVAEKLSLENKLRRALERDQLVLHYQPKVDINSGKINGLEALIRWNDPEMGLVPPLKFVPLLEETGMIMEAGMWALGKAVSDALDWQAKGLPPLRVAVNVSPVQLHQRNFVGIIEHVLNGRSDVAAILELEITESLVMQDIVSNIQKLRVIREMGVTVAIDDFGTGYSSLSYIAKLPANTLKIDRSFIMNMASNSDDKTIVSTIISLAHSLGMRVVAEGVETDEQARFLRLLKCDEFQGFLFSPAVPAEQIEKLLREGTSLHC